MAGLNRAIDAGSTFCGAQAFGKIFDCSVFPPCSDPPDMLGLEHRPTSFPHSNAGRFGDVQFSHTPRVSAAGNNSFLETSSVTLDRLFAEHRCNLVRSPAVVPSGSDSSSASSITMMETTDLWNGCPFHKLELYEIGELPATRMLWSSSCRPVPKLGPLEIADKSAA